MKVKVYHECEKPSMHLGKEVREYEDGFWIFKRNYTETYDIWEIRTVEFTCIVCASTWEYHNLNKYSEGAWWAKDRTWEWKPYVNDVKLEDR